MSNPKDPMAALEADDRSGATDLTRRAVAVLVEARARGPEALHGVVRRLCRAQPCMASIWAAAAASLRPDGADGSLATFLIRFERAQRAVVRVACDRLAPEAHDGTLRLVTCSASRTVTSVFEELARSVRLTAACAEGRPALEGRTQAEQLAAAGMSVEFYTDAGLGQALAEADADALVLGADAVAPTWFANKAGSAALVALASQLGVPVYVVATRDKLVPETVADRLALKDGGSDGVWAEAPAGVRVRNPYFERVALETVSGVVTDVGVLGADMVRQACAAREDAFGPVFLNIISE